MRDPRKLHRKARSWFARIRREAVDQLSSTFSDLPDKKQAWQDLIRLLEDENVSLGLRAVELLGAAFPHLPEAYRAQAWADLIRLTGDENVTVGLDAAELLGAAFPHLPEAHRAQARADLHRLIGDKNEGVRLYANHALGKVSVFKATETKNDEDFRKELESALAFFDAASQESTSINPALFCLLFYRFYYAITFQRSGEDEVQRYLTEAKQAAGGSKSREDLIEAIENLADALTEAGDAQASDLKTRQRDLNAYRRYCDRAAALLEVTEEKAPGATKLLRRGLPIIDKKIKAILGEIQEKAAEVCRESKGTPLEDLGHEINHVGKKLELVKGPIGLERQVAVMEVTITSICEKMARDEREDACKLLEMAKLEPHAEDKLPWFNTILSKIPAQLSKMKERKTIEIKGPVEGSIQIAVGNGNVQEIDL